MRHQPRRSHPLSQPGPSTFSAGTRQEQAQHRLPGSIAPLIFAACLTSTVTAVHYTNYGPLIPIMQSDLHINSAQAGLMSPLLFLGLAVAYLPAGALADRYGQRPVLIGSSTLIVLGSVLLPLIPNITWVVLCGFTTGIGAGGAFDAGAGVAAGMGKHAPLAQGLYGGSVQIGSGLGLLVTPLLYDWLGWRGAFLFWGLLGISAIIAWLLVTGGLEAHTPTKLDNKAGPRSPSLRTLWLSHCGTACLAPPTPPRSAVSLVPQY